ncbi:MAG TPA: FAD-binding protein, partial [Paraburkholderia sp.]|nr:FAD-binding protein [Paraburkholderia sp.]
MTAAPSFNIVEILRQRLGDDAVLADEASRRFYANDIFWQPGVAPLAVVLPRSAEEAAAAVGAATYAGVAVVPRGGGMSYTKGYLPARAQSVVIDATRLNRVTEVNAADAYITVET